MLLEIHILQNFAPSNLNRDDTGSPKDCTFGGFRRARISSQCLKRAIRTDPTFAAEVGNKRGTRTKLLAGRIADTLADLGRDRGAAEAVTVAALEASGYKFDKPEGKAPKTKVLLYVSPGEINRYAEVLNEHFDDLASKLEKDAAAKKPKGIKLEKSLNDALKAIGTKQDAADIALFGRMVAETSNMSINAACQVAHALSTHAVDVEMDFYTAVDDLQPDEDTGAGMMGIIEFNSACFYRYAAVHVDQVADNLHGDRDSARSAALGFLKAAVAAIPSGKQNSMAAHNAPAYVRVKVRNSGAPCSLANAFSRPVRVNRRDDDLVGQSIAALEAHNDALAGMYGDAGVRLDQRASISPDHRDGTLSELYTAVEEALT